MNRKSAIQFALALVLVAWAGTSLAADWPQFRGPVRDDISKETGLLAQWPADGPALAWKLNGLGIGYSGPAIVGGKLYIMGDKAGQMNVIALDLATQKTAWETKVGPEYKNPNGDGPRCTPTVDGDSLYVLTPQGDLVCLKTADGKEVWRKNLEKDFGGKMMSRWGYSESPLVDGDNVVCTPGGAQGAVLALNKKTGAPVWQSKEITDNASYSSLYPVTFGGVKQYLQLSDKTTYAVAADSGKLLWQAATPGKTAVITTPVFKDGVAFVTMGYGVGHYGVQVTAEGGAFKAAGIYNGKEMTNHHGGVVLVGDNLYGFSDNNNMLKCMELKTGKVLWEDKCVGKGSVSCADGHLYVRAEKDGTVALVEATPAGYKETGRFAQPGRPAASQSQAAPQGGGKRGGKDGKGGRGGKGGGMSSGGAKPAWVHPVISDGKLYLRDHDLLLCYNVK